MTDPIKFPPRKPRLLYSDNISQVIPLTEEQAAMMKAWFDSLVQGEGPKKET